MSHFNPYSFLLRNGRLQDRLVVDLNDLDQIVYDENESVGRWRCQGFRLKLSNFRDRAPERHTSTLCEWEDENNKCVEFTPLKYTLSQKKGWWGTNEIKVPERQGVPEGRGSCKTKGSRRCPEGSVVWGYEGKSGSYIDQVKLNYLDDVLTTIHTFPHTIRIRSTIFPKPLTFLFKITMTRECITTSTNMSTF